MSESKEDYTEEYIDNNVIKIAKKQYVKVKKIIKKVPNLN